MSTTSAREDRATGPHSPSPTNGPVLAPPPKMRRRPALMAGGVAAICLGGLVGAWAWSSTTNTEDVLAARVTIHRGDLIRAGDLERIRINGDPGLSPVPASNFAAVVGQRAALDIAGGSLLTRSSTTAAALPPPGQSVVGISLTAAQAPALALHGGDQVRIIVTPGQNGETASGTPQFSTAQVVDTRNDQSSGNTIVDVLVPHADASILAAHAATGNVALVLDSAQDAGQDAAESSSSGPS